jgi:SH3-like domain-containing protein
MIVNSSPAFMKITKLLTLLAFLCAAAVAQQSVAKPDSLVARPVINLYDKPSADSSVASQALYGSGVLSLEKQGDWVRLRTGDDYTGWVAAADLIPLHAGYAPPGHALHVIQLSANLYREPSVTTHAPVLNLPWESRLELLPGKVDDAGRWLHVRLVDGRTAYVEQGNVSADLTPLTIDQSLQLARRFLGVTYTWGGVSSYGYDCSGFTQMLVRQRGIIMPRDADVQMNWSGVLPVERKNLQPGDLLFFGASADKITHTGMYLGNGEFIHDTTNTHPVVQISNLDQMPWTKLLVAARRVK